MGHPIQAQNTSMNQPSPTDISRIAAQPDPVLRNLQITLCYHRLALVLAERFGREANWCTFATWASKQAGRTIRKEDLADTLEAYFGDPETVRVVEAFAAGAARWGLKLKVGKLVEGLWKAGDPEAAFSHSSAAVARGNLKVFAEIGHEFARFYAECLDDGSFDPERIGRFTAGLRPGPPPDGQDYLRAAFENYYTALFEQDANARSELLLLANIRIGFHEQTRLQPEIVEALEAPVISPETFTRNLLRAYDPDGGWRSQAVRLALRALGGLIGFDGFIDRVLAGARKQVQHLVTQTMMTIEMPSAGQLKLGKDLTGSFPRHLMKIDNPELAELLALVDPTRDSLKGSGAQYWGDLPDRLHFIVDLFRRYHAEAKLAEAPFSETGVAEIDAGRVPAGKLQAFTNPVPKS